MNWFIAGWVLVLQAIFWGYGLTQWVLPPRWRRFWPGFVAPVGLALQSAVVWAGAHTNLPGTDSYGLASLLLPLALAGWTIRRAGAGAAWRTFAAARGWSVLLPVMTLSLSLQIAPFTKPPGLLTSQSLGSCDAADYAAGARVFKEFASRDRSGFVGQTEAVRVLDVDNFFDFWLRINHFTPSALLALDSTLLRRQPYELTSLLGVALVLLNLPTVFWLARSAFRFSPWAAGLVTTIYGVSPVVLYAVYQVALAQLLAAPAVALLLWTGLQADRAARVYRRPRRAWGYAGLFLVANSLLLGSYNFFVLFAFVPLAAYVGGRALLRRGRWRSAWWLGGFIGSSLLACTVLFPARVIGVGERLFLFDKTPFGWPIATFRPDGWYGIFGDVYVRPAAPAFLCLGLLGLAGAGAAAWSLVRRGEGRTVGLAAACTLPILCGYGILSWEEAAHVRQNASYDAYKLFSVFYPTLLLGFCLFLRAPGRVPAWRGAAGALAGVFLALNLQGAWRYNETMRRRAYMVNRDLSNLAVLESRPEVDGINLRLEPLWDRIWANQFLLHKRQYPMANTYEGRNPLPPRGRWDLRYRQLSTNLPGDRDLLENNAVFVLPDRLDPAFLDLRLGAGWYEAENSRSTHWCWSKGGPATVQVLNPRPTACAVQIRLRGHACTVQPLRLFVGDAFVWEGTLPTRPGPVGETTIQLPPGETTLRLETPGEPDHVPGDWRPFGFALYGLELRPVEVPANVPAAQP